MNITNLVVFLGAYLIGMPILLWLFIFAHKKLVIQRAMEKAKKNTKNLPEPIWPKMKERLKFTMKDTRPMKLGKKEGAGPPNRAVFFGLYLAGLLCYLLTPITGKYILLFLGLVLFIACIGFGVKASNDVISTRLKHMKRMYEIGKSKLGAISESGNPAEVVTVLEWKDLIKPQKVQYKVPDTFAASGEEGFLQQFNQIFGMETAWVPTEDKETGAPGWNYEEATVTINAVPPLPGMAKWDESYVLDPGIAWSFFPIGLGVENGIERTNPKTGEVENILGFDLSGEATKVAKAAGYSVSNTITTSPMVFIGGGTGGGKSLHTETPVWVND